MKVTDNETRWAKIGEIKNVAFVGKETIFFGAGCHLVFIHLITADELLYTANNYKVGDGIKCYTGHRTQNIFAYAENRTNANIFIKSYPNFEEIYCLNNPDESGYVYLTFSESSFLITVGDLPEFRLTVWNWRLGEKIASHNAGIIIEQQFLKCNLGSPVFLAQLGLNSNILHVWDIFICGKKCILTEHRTTIEEKCEVFTDVLWTSEGGLFVLDSAGCIYTSFPDYHLEKVIDFTESGPNPTSFVWYKSGIAVSGPNNEIRHYKKSGSWTVDWSMIPPESPQKLTSRFEYLVLLTSNLNILQVLPSQNEFKCIKEKESCFNDLCLVYPMGRYFMVLTHKHIINLFKVDSGELIHTLDLKLQATMMVENPKFPYAAIGFDNGIIKLISAYNPENLSTIAELFLMREPINCIKFNECGTVFVAANLYIGRFFIIEGLPGGEMEIVATIDCKRQIVDYMIIISQDCYRIFMIPVTSKFYFCGNVVLRYCVIKGKKHDIKEYTFEEKNAMFCKIVATSGPTRDRVFFLVPNEGKNIMEAEIKRGDNLAKILRKIVTGHQMQDIHFKLDRRFALTWAYDGLVIARDCNFNEEVGIYLPHHRTKGGVKKAYIDPHGKYIVSLGKEGVLVCSNMMERQIDKTLEEELQQLHESKDYKLMFSRRGIRFIPNRKFEGKCYLEVEELQKIEAERIRCHDERESILKEFKSIKKELQELLTANLKGPENEKLDLKEFNLNTKLYEEKALHHKKKRKATENYLKRLIQAHNAISDFMIKNYWEKMQIQGTAIKGIFANFEVTNYVLRPPNANREETLNWIRHQRKIERYLNEMNSFYPWEPKPEDELIKLVTSRPQLPVKDEHLKVLSKLEVDAPEIEEVEDDIETKIAFSGSDIARFIEVQDAHYLQNELQTYFQSELQWIISKSDCYKLKEFFNQRFNKVMLQKIKEMDNIIQRNNRLRHIVSELNYFSEEKVHVSIEDPEWKQIENPELIIQVKDEEVPITPYISPSEQAILDAKAAEAERIRLLLLADDFRERALMAMMNGVLEVRWEDELKKDVPLPKCMIEKQPENYNEDDLRAVRDYEEKVQFLKSERERYKAMLRAEYAKLANSVRENIKKFNNRLGELLNIKLSVDAAISQESLKINRTKLHQTRRKILVEKEQNILKKISENDELISSLHKLLNKLHDSVAECRNYLDSFQTKDKYLERAFKKDFQDMSIVIQEQASKLFRKRPKMNFRSINSSTMLNELAKCILSNTKPPLTLNSDCFEFLKQMDNLDTYVGVPTVVDEHTFAVICKHRRLRVEYEIRVKAAEKELAEAEATIAAFNKRLHQKKELGAKLHNDLEELRNELLRVICDTSMQIVLPRGLVEIPLAGSRKDFEDAVLVCRKDVEDINKIILDYGSKKIKALEKNMTFRRRILALEWEHKRKRMLIEDLQEKRVDIEGVRLTKEMQAYLKSKDKEKSIPFETEVDMIKGSYENTIQDRKDTVRRMKKQIRAIKEHNKIIEAKITELNVDVCEYNFMKDREIDEKERSTIDSRMKTLLRRSKLVQQIQDNHHEILMLQTELEILRLKTFPTLKYKVV